MNINKRMAQFHLWAISPVKNNSTADAERGRRIITSDLWGVGVGAAVTAYFASEYIAFYPPAVRAIIGLGLFLNIIMIHRALSVGSNWRKSAWLIIPLISCLAVLIFGLDYIWATTDAVESAEIRCAHIQHEMLNPHPRRADLPNIFQALGCHASGGEDIGFPLMSVQSVKPSLSKRVPT